MRFLSKTKGNVSPRGKKTIFIHAAEEDSDLRDRAAELIFSLENGHNFAVWYTDEPFELFSNNADLDYLSVVIYIPVVTDSFMKRCDSLGAGKVKAFLETLMMKGVAILPLFTDREMICAFNKKVGAIHAVRMDTDLTSDLLDSQIKRFLPDDELYSTVEDKAFDGKLFLSYRKKDRAEALEVMKAIHDTAAAAAAGIWFDDFLVAGRDYNEQIDDQLRESDAMALVVTPNLLEKGNYVHNTEYPKAHIEYRKKVVPVEAAATDIESLRSDYDGIVEVTDINNRPELEKQLKSAGFAPGKRSAYRDYLLGMAFYLGIRVEKDMDRAVKLMKSASDRGSIDADEKLAFFYIAGIGAKRDHNAAVEYLLQAKDRLQNEFKNDPVESIKRLYRLLYGTDGLCLLLKSLDRCDEANKVCREFLDYLEKIPKDELKDYDLYEAQGYLHLSDLFYESNVTEQQIDKEIAELKKARSIIIQADHQDDEIKILHAQILGSLAECFKRKNEDDEAKQYYQDAEKMITALYEKTGRVDCLKLLVSINIDLGMLYRKEATFEMMKRPLETLIIFRPVRKELSAAVENARKLVEIQASQNNRESLSIALYDLALVESEKKKMLPLMEESLKIAQEIADECGDGSYDYLTKQVADALHKTKNRGWSIFKNFLILLLIVVISICLGLQLAGDIDIIGWIKGLFGG